MALTFKNCCPGDILTPFGTLRSLNCLYLNLGLFRFCQEISISPYHAAETELLRGVILNEQTCIDSDF